MPTSLTHARAVVLYTLPAILDVAGALIAAVHAPLARGTFSTGSSVVVELVAGITAAVEVGGRGDVGAVLLTARLPTPVPLFQLTVVVGVKLVAADTEAGVLAVGAIHKTATIVPGTHTSVGALGFSFTRVSIIVQYKSRPVTRATVAAQCVDTLLSAAIGGGQPALVVVFTLTGSGVEGEPCIAETEEASRIVLTALAAWIAAALVDVFTYVGTRIFLVTLFTGTSVPPWKIFTPGILRRAFIGDVDRLTLIDVLVTLVACPPGLALAPRCWVTPV